MNPHHDMAAEDGPDGQFDPLIDAIQQLAAIDSVGKCVGQAIAQGVQRRAMRDARLDDPEFEDRLLARWRDDGLLSGRAGAHDTLRSVTREPVRGWLRPLQWPRWAQVASLASVAVMLVLPALYRTLTPAHDGAVMRGAESAQTIAADDPAAVANQLESALRADGAVVRRVLLDRGAVQLQAKVPASAHASRLAIERAGASVPAHGRLDLIVMPR